jgi:hypothetical protein
VLQEPMSQPRGENSSLIWRLAACASKVRTSTRKLAGWPELGSKEIKKECDVFTRILDQFRRSRPIGRVQRNVDCSSDGRAALLGETAEETYAVGIR